MILSTPCSLCIKYLDRHEDINLSINDIGNSLHSKQSRSTMIRVGNSQTDHYPINYEKNL